MDPMMFYVTAQGVPSDKIEHAGYAIAGSWRGEPLEVVKCKSNDLLVPAWSETVIEGEILRDRRTEEGPWGENADIYASSKSALLMQVNCITHRKDPINYGLICRPLLDCPKFLMGGAIKSYLMTQVDTVRDAYVFPRTGNRPLRWSRHGCVEPMTCRRSSTRWLVCRRSRTSWSNPVGW